jgi:hypothetical protein
MSKVYALKQFKQTPEHKKVCFKAAVQRKTETKKKTNLSMKERKN